MGGCIVRVRTLPVVVPLPFVVRVRTLTVLPTANGPSVLPLGSAAALFVKPLSVPATCHSTEPDAVPSKLALS